MLARLNTTSEISLFPTGLGNHYTSGNRNLVPPGRRRFPYNHASEAGAAIGDPGVVAGSSSGSESVSFREPRDRFGPDVLVIAGLAMACLGAALTLVSLYTEFKHPAIQATMAGVGPSLVGIGALFCVLRLFFCTFCVSRTCCERLTISFSRQKKKVHPLRVKDMGAKKAANIANGQLLRNGDSSLTKALAPSGAVKERQQQQQNSNNNNNNNVEQQQGNNNNEPLQQRDLWLRNGDPRQQQHSNAVERQQGERDPVNSERDSSEVAREAPARDLDPIREEGMRTPEDKGGGDEDILRDEIDLLDSPRLHEDINDLVRKTAGRY